MMQQVMQLHLNGANHPAQRLFVDTPSPIIATQPTRRSAAPPKSRAASVPVRHSMHQAAQQSSVPVAKRASLLLVKRLGMLGPKEKMTAKAAEALIRCFDEPLTDEDISIIAKLTRLDPAALRIAGSMAGPDADADAAA
ncbi:hypothetical protein CFC21_007306 [Triticum aestivum]|uniref:Uncharacterized protein n=2 Tax=Triticum aestivum TaxID=4565 RepID=A0A3B5YYI9_WHEAT|nr:hypothetical protein CFC21_007306 [Triticum aestivum]